MKEKIKKIVLKDETQKIVRDSIFTLSEIVGVTLGPSGRPVLIEREGLAPLVTKDGVTVAKTIGVADSASNTVIEAAKEICLRTAKEAGDGTTSAIVLAAELSKNISSYLEDNRVSPQLFMRKINFALGLVLNLIQEQKVEIENDEQLLNVAIISTNGDEDMAKVVIQAIKQSGDEGHILIEEATGKDLEIEKTDGYCIKSGLKDSGALAQAFINDRANSCFQGQNGPLMLYNGTIVDVSPIQTLISLIRSSVASGHTVYNNEAIVIVAHGFSDSAYDYMSKETLSGHPIIPIKTPRTGVPASATEMLFDLACYFNCEVVDNISINNLKLEDIALYQKIKCTHFDTVVSHFDVVAEDHINRIDLRIQELNAQLEQAPSEFDKAHIRASIARLSEGMVTIKVSGYSDLEVRERKGRVEDAVEALRSALESGFVPGGGATHMWIHSKLMNYESENKLEQEAVRILAKSITHPCYLLLLNAGVPEVWDQYSNYVEKGLTKVYDALNHYWIDVSDQKIIEPVKVLNSSISNAVSVAGLLTTLGGIVTIPRHADIEAQMDAAKSIMGNGG